MSGHYWKATEAKALRDKGSSDHSDKLFDMLIGFYILSNTSSL